MIKVYFNIGWRNLLNNKGFSFTNLLGLTIGITCAIFIFLWVQDELNYNSSQKNYHEIYQVMAHRVYNQVFTDQNMVLPLAAAIENEVPQVEHAAVITHAQPGNLAYGDLKVKKIRPYRKRRFFEYFFIGFCEGRCREPYG